MCIILREKFGMDYGPYFFKDDEDKTITNFFAQHGWKEGFLFFVGLIYVDIYIKFDT